jgi:hypothetical protein
MKRSYLFNDRDIAIPPPSKVPEWRSVTPENTTSQTREALRKFQEFFPNVSFFSWHPNIPQAQYRGKDMWGSNYNKRILIGDSVIIRSRPGTKSAVAVDRGWDTIREAMEHIPEAEVMGGNGDSDDTTKSYQMQLSFLKTVGTHEEANEICERVLTAGAYTFKNGEWFYIPADEFNPWIEIEEKMNRLTEEIVNILRHHPIVKDIKPYSLQNRTEEEAKNYYCTVRFQRNEDQMVLTVYENHYTLTLNKFTTFWTDEEKGKLNLKMTLERLGGLKEHQIEQLVADPSSYKQVLHEYRGAVAARKFGF